MHLAYEKGVYASEFAESVPTVSLIRVENWFESMQLIVPVTPMKISLRLPSWMNSHESPT